MSDFFEKEQAGTPFFENVPTPAPKKVVQRDSTLSAIVAGPEAGLVVKNELEATGKSETKLGILDQAAAIRSQYDKETLNEIVQNPAYTPEQKNELLRARVKDLNTTTAPSLMTLANEQMAMTAETSDANAEAIQTVVAKNIDMALSVEQQMAVVPSTMNMGGPVLEQLADFSMAAALPGWSINVREVINSAIPGFVGLDEVLPWPLGATGNFIKRFKDHMLTLQPEERLEVMKRLAEGAENNRFFALDNGFVKYDIYTELTEDLHEANWEVILNNFIGTVEYAGFGIFTTAAKLTSRALGLGKVAKLAGKNADILKEKIAAGEVTVLPGESKSGKPRYKVQPTTVEVLPGQSKSGKPRYKVHPVVTAINKVEDTLLNPTEQKPVGSVSKQMDKVAPVDSARVAALTLDDATSAAADAVGVTREQVTSEHILFKQADQETTLAPDLNDDLAAVYDINPNLTAYTGAEQELFSKELEGKVRTIVSASPRAHLNKMAIRTIPGGYEARTIIGDSSTHGFSSLKLARDTARTFKQFSDATSKILVKNPDGSGYMDVLEAQKLPWFNPKEGEFVIEMKVAEQINPSVALETTELFEKNSFAGKFAQWLDPSSVFVGWINRARGAAIAAESAVNKTLLNTLHPLTKLNDNDQAKVIQALDIGDRQEKWYDDEFLLDMWREEKHPDRLLAGYKAAVKHNKMIYNILNKRLYNLLQTEDVKQVVLPKDPNLGQRVVLGQVIKRKDLRHVQADNETGVPGEISKIYDAESKQIIDVDTLALDALEADPNVRFIKFRTSVKHGNQTMDYAVLRGDAAKLKKLPKYVLKDQPGYVARIYDAPYILKEVYTDLRNGKLMSGTRAVRMYATRGEAERDLSRLNLELTEDSGIKYRIDDAKELREDTEFANRTSLEYFENAGMLFYSQRGTEVKGLDGARMVHSIADSMGTMRARAARAQTLDPLVDKLTANWEKRYGAKYGKMGKMPFEETDVLRHDASTLDRNEYARAVALHRHIRMVAGVDTSIAAKVMRDTMVGFSDFLTTTFNNTPVNNIGGWLAKNRNRNPLNGAKGATFTSFIIMNPLVQLPLQAMQMSMYLGLDHTMKYVFREKGYRHHMALLSGSLMNELGIIDKNFDALVKVSGMSSTDYDRLLRAYKNSGIPSSVDSHMYAMMSNLDRNMAVSSYWGKTWEFWNQFRRFARRVGFDAGEHTQLSSAWLAARNRWIKQNPSKADKWDSPENLGTITGEARALSGNMDKGGMQQFQKGFLGLMFQFLSHTTKMTQILIREKLPYSDQLDKFALTRKASEVYTGTVGKFSQKAWSDAEKTRMAMLQLGIFGTGAYGLNSVFESQVANLGLELPEDFMQAVQEGLVGTTYNMVINAALDQDSDLESDIEFTARVAPLSGVGGQAGVFGMGNPVGHMANAIFMADKRALEILAGPSYSLGKKGHEFVKFTSAIVGYNWDVPPGELDPMVGITIVDEAARQFAPVWNNFIRGRAEQSINRFISNAGNPGVEISDGEAWSRRYFGLMPRTQRQVSEELIELRGLLGHPQEESLKQQLNDQAAQYYKYIKRVVEHKVGTGDDLSPVVDQAILFGNSMKQFLEQDEYDYLFGRVATEIANDFRAKSPESELVRQLMSYYKDGVPSLFDEAYITKLKNYNDFPGKEEAIQILEDMK